MFKDSIDFVFQMNKISVKKYLLELNRDFDPFKVSCFLNFMRFLSILKFLLVMLGIGKSYLSNIMKDLGAL